MNLSRKWLSDYVDISDVSDKAYCDRMTDTGSKVEGFEVMGADIKNVVVGKVAEIEHHPDADKLWICQIDAGTGTNIQIVTGAQNVKKGDLVPVAMDGSSLPGGINIKKGKLRGVESNGMLCSISELGLTTHDVPYAIEDGILILEEDCKPGDDIHDVMELSDTVVEFEITSNRPDCLSMIGLARETGVSFDRPVTIKEPDYATDKNDNVSNYVKVTVEDPELCMRYCAAAVKNVKIAPSPKWLRTRLRMAGIRPINNIVDITNYVMTEYGQPMHAFDRNFLEGGEIIVRRAKAGEKITTLDGIERNITEDMLMICDGKKPVCVAGVMGGENSEINDATTTVIFESATFFGPSVRTTARDLGMRTESSGRFEKGLDPENSLGALKRACELVVMLGAGEIADGIIDVYGKKEEKTPVKFEPDRINGLIGTSLCADEMIKIFDRLSIKCEKGMLVPPSWRADLVCMADYAEEVARIFGYNKIEATCFKSSARVGGYNEKQRFRVKVGEICTAMGLYQSQTYSFISPKTFDLLELPENSSLRDAIEISNPLGEDTSIMRTTAIGSVLSVLAHNRNRRAESAGIFDMAKIYLKKTDNDLADELDTLVIGFYNMGDFYDLKGMCETLLDEFEPIQTKAVKGYEFKAVSPEGIFHKTRCAEIVKGDERIALIGQIDPKVADNYQLDLPVYVAEIYLEKVFSLKDDERQYTALPKFPAATRDLAFVCDASLEVGTLYKTIAKYAGDKLEKIAVFDIYTGEQLGEGKKSVAFNLTLRDKNKTLTVEDADKITAKIMKGAERDLGVTLR